MTAVNVSYTKARMTYYQKRPKPFWVCQHKRRARHKTAPKKWVIVKAHWRTRSKRAK